MGGRTRVVEERDGRPDKDRYQYQTMEQAGMHIFYPPPRKGAPGELHSASQVSRRNVQQRSGLERTEVRNRRNSYIELNIPHVEDSHTGVVEMRLAETQSGAVDHDYKVRAAETCIAKYPIRDMEWRRDIFIQDEAEWYYSYVKRPDEYNRSDSAEAIRLGNQMAGVAGRYRLAARAIQEVNFRRRGHSAERIESARHVAPTVAPQLIDISRRWVIPEYRGALQPDNRISHNPYVQADREKSRRNCGTTSVHVSW